MSQNFSKNQILIIESCIRKVFCEIFLGESKIEDLAAIAQNIRSGLFDHTPGGSLKENFEENIEHDILSLLLKTKEIYNSLSNESKLSRGCDVCGCTPCDCH